MRILTRSQYHSRAAVAKALAHPSRLLIVDLLRAGEKCAGDLVTAVGAEGPTVSRHLAVLQNAGLVAQDKRGAFVFYRLTCPCVSNFFTCMDSVVTAHAKSLGKSA